MNRKLSDWASIAEIISAVAIVVSLIFVGMQIRDNTVATEAATFQDSVGYDLQLLTVVGSDPESTRLFYAFRNDPDSLDAHEALQAQALFLASVRHMENLFLQYEAGMLSDEAWATRDPSVRATVRTPGFSRLLSNVGDEILGGSFIDYAYQVRNEANLEAAQ